MKRQTRFTCHNFFENTSIFILEISAPNQTTGGVHFEWLLIDQSNLSVRPMLLKSRDGSTSIQERYFDLGFLKFDSSAAVLIEPGARALHHLEHKNCENIPEEYLSIVEAHLENIADPIIPIHPMIGNSLINRW